MPSDFSCRNIARFASDGVLRRSTLPILQVSERSPAGRTVSDKVFGLAYRGFRHRPIGPPAAVTEDGRVISATKGARHDIT